MKTWTTIDRTGWPSGPWDDEPDKIQWVDEDTGLDCLIVRQPTNGHLCGYVGVPPDHPWHGFDYDQCTEGGCDDWCGHSPNELSVHGGLTYAAPCAEAGDPASAICHIPEPGRPDDVWWFGFDCAHLGDEGPAERNWTAGYGRGGTYRTVGYVEAEAARLAAQLAEVSS